MMPDDFLGQRAREMRAKAESEPDTPLVEGAFTVARLLVWFLGGAFVLQFLWNSFVDPMGNAVPPITYGTALGLTAIATFIRGLRTPAGVSASRGLAVDVMALCVLYLAGLVGLYGFGG